jgi:biopolymer transport protein ExbD
MSRFKKKRGAAQPAISTASLPDIIFMLLFFFMVVTVMKQSDLKVTFTPPTATELQELENKSMVSYIYVGRPLEKYREVYGSAPRVQIMDKFLNTNNIDGEVAAFLQTQKTKIPEAQHPFMTTSLRVDKTVTMGIVGDVKTALRKAGQLRINYSARPRVGEL